MKHPRTRIAEIAVSRAQKALAKLHDKRATLDLEITVAERNLREAEYDLSLNVGLDEGRYGAARVP
jgi:hypothetical protein